MRAATGEPGPASTRGMWGTDMGTITAATGSPTMTEKASGATPVRHLWQAPVFVVGVAALLAVGLTRSPRSPDPAHRLEQHLAAAREQLAQPGGDLEEAVQLALQALEEAERFPERLGEAHFLLGTAYLRMGDRAAARDPALAQQHWTDARENLDMAEKRGVAPEEAGRLQYRLGKVGFLLKDKPERVAKLLAAGADQAEDRAEAYRLLTQAYLALNPPNLTGALHANERLRQEVPHQDEKVLGPAKLLGGELLLRLGQPVQARKVLEKISEKAPPEVLAQARLLRARTYQDEGKWKEAAELWKAVLEDPRAPPPEPGRILYNLGVCHRGLDEPGEAAAKWEECLRKGRGDEAPAAALALAEAHLHEGEPGAAKALELFRQAVGRVRSPEEWTNSLVELPRAREVFERAIQDCRQAGRFQLAVQLSEIYDCLALPGRGPALRAELYVGWAHALQDQAAAATDPLARQKEEDEARKMMRQAGAAQADAAARAATPAEQAEHLWQGAGCFLQGEDWERGAVLLQRFLERNPGPERQGEGWFLLADAYRHLNQQDAAIIAYTKCIEFRTPFAYRAKYHLALAAIEKNKIDEAEEILTENLKNLRRTDQNRDQEAYEKSLFTLGDLLYRRKEYKKVVQHLEEGVGRFPANPEATRAHYQLADSYRLLASQEHIAKTMHSTMSEKTRDAFLTEHIRWLKKAAKEFDDLAQDLKSGNHRGHLPPDVEIQIPFIAANCYFNAGEYDKALERFTLLAAQYHRQGVAGVLALEGAVRVHAARAGRMSATLAVPDSQEARARVQAAWEQEMLMKRRLEEIRAALPTLPEKDRPVWEKWLQDAGKTVNEWEKDLHDAGREAGSGPTETRGRRPG
jgi:tetratricopeptide (TPR) repeat protein